MKRKSLLVILAVSLLVGVTSCADRQKTAEPFTFVQISDPQLGFGEEEGFEKGEELLAETVRMINEINPPFVIVTGDMTNSSTSEEQYQAYKRLMSGLNEGIKLYHVPGNHDVKLATEPENLKRYIEKYGDDGFCFKYANTTFIGINSCLVMDGAGYEESLQLSWLSSRLEEAAGSDHIFVFMHCPIVTSDLDQKEGYSNFPMLKRRTYVDLFKKYGVECVFAGHLHSSHDVTIEGLRLYTCGPSGLPLGNGFSGINAVTVSSDSYECDYRAVKP